MATARASQNPDVRPVRDPNLVTRQIAGETLLIRIRSWAAELDFLFVLNDTAAWIWERIDGSRSVDQLVQELLTAFQVDPAQARHDVDDLLGGLREAGLLHDQTD